MCCIKYCDSDSRPAHASDPAITLGRKINARSRNTMDGDARLYLWSSYHLVTRNKYVSVNTTDDNVDRQAGHRHWIIDLRL